MKKLRTIPMRRVITALLCGLMVFYTVACTYYKVAVKSRGALPEIAAVQGEKIMYLHNGDEVYLIKSLAMAEENGVQYVAMELDSAGVPVSLAPHRADYPTKDTPAWDTTYLNKPIYYPERKKRYRAPRESAVTREVHFYLTELTEGLAPGVVQLPASAFKEIHVLKKDVGSTVYLVVLTTVGVFVIFTIILALTKSSCPYVYAFDGNQFIFQGEIYSGAVLHNLERADYLPMPLLQAKKGAYRLRIANELKEQQFVNFAELQAIRHPEGTQALFDVNGAPQLIAAPQLPRSATSALGNNAGELTAQKEGLAFLFDEEQAGRNSLTLQFENRPGAAQAKLILSAKNSMWFDHLFGRFAAKFGAAYPAWVQIQENMSRAQRIQTQNDQDFPLSVYLKTASGDWQLAGRFPLAGPLGWRDMVLPLDPALLQGETVDIRLETGYRFWEVDYAAIDFSENNGMEIVTLPVKSAKDQDGNSQLKALANDDDQYLEQLRTGDYTEMCFRALQPPKGQAQTLFLHTKGYYVHVRDFKGEPQMDALEKFRQPHYFDQFSKAEYRQFISGIRLESDEPVIK